MGIFKLTDFQTPGSTGRICKGMFNPGADTSVQLDWLRIAEWAYAGIFSVAVLFQNQDQCWIPCQTNEIF